MSPEKQPERKRTSHGWAIHERKRKAEIRRNQKLILQPIKPTTPEERQRKHTTASWASVKGLLNLETSNNPMLHSIYQEAILTGGQIRYVVKGWYDAAYKDATSGSGLDEKYRKEFAQQLKDEGTSQIILEETTPLLKMIDRILFKPVGVKK